MAAIIDAVPRRAPRLAGWLAVLALPCSLHGAFAAEWRLAPRAEVRTTWSDNVRLGHDGERRGDFVQEAEPGFTASGKGHRFSVDVDYTADLLWYLRGQGDSGLRHKLQAGLGAELLDELLFIDAKALIGQQNISPFGEQFVDNVHAAANRATVYVASVSPFLRQRLGSFAKSELRYTHDSFSSNNDALAASETDRAMLDLKNGSSLVNLGWGLHAEGERVHFARSGTLINSRKRADVSVKLLSTLAVTASAGHERYGYTALDTLPQGSSRMLGLHWRPSTRTELELASGRRFFGKTYALNASHRARLGAVMLSYQEDITNAQAQFRIGTVDSTSAFLDRLWTLAVPDATLRKEKIDSFLREAGSPLGVPGATNAFSNRYFLQKSAQANLGLQGARNLVMLTAHATTRIVQSASFAPPPPDGLPSPFDDMHDTREVGLQALWRLKFNARTQSTFNASTDRVAMAAIGRTDRHHTLRAGLAHQWSRQLRGSVELRHVRQSSNLIPGSAREHAIAVTLSALL
jgi:uncharacterized protein (PEP-CTERM system associated)